MKQSRPQGGRGSASVTRRGPGETTRTISRHDRRETAVSSRSTINHNPAVSPATSKPRRCPMTKPTNREEDKIMSLLRRGLDHSDPVPPDVTEFAKAALSWRAIDAELAALSHDSTD